MKIKVLFLVGVMILFLVSCNKNTNDLISYEFFGDEVNFTIDYPKSWEFVEHIEDTGDLTRDASPDAGIQFFFSDDNIDSFFIGAMRFSTLTFDEESYQAEEFITTNNLCATVYTWLNSDETVSVFYVFESDSPPHYFAAVNMSTATYDKNKDDISKVMKQFKPIRNAGYGSQEPPLVDNQEQSIDAQTEELSVISFSKDEYATLQSLQEEMAFIKSYEYYQIHVFSWKFAKACLSNDIDTMKNLMALDAEIDVTSDIFDDLDFLIVKYIEKKSDGSIYVSCEFQKSGDDFYSYLTTYIVNVDGEWKVTFYAFEL